MAPSVATKSNWALLVLLLIYVSNQWCRYLLNYLYAVSSTDPKQSLEVDTGITTAQYGLLVGFGFSLTYVLVGLVMGRAADVYSRVNIIFAGVIIWSIALLQMALANGFAALLAARIVLGIGEAFSGPASYSLIADFFPPADRGQANGIYAFGVYVGGGLGSLSLALARGVGWRATCYGVAASGAVLAVLLRATVREPARTGKAISGSAKTLKEPQLTVKQSLKEVFGTPLVVSMLVAGSARFMAGYCLGAYLPVFYKAQFPSYNAQYSYINASVVSLGGAISSYAGGVAADVWDKRGEVRARLYVPAIGAALAIPTLAMALYSRNFYLSMAGLLLEYLAAECWFGGIMSTLQGALPSSARGVGVAIFSLVTTLAGSGAVWLLGYILDHGGGHKADVNSDVSASSVRDVLMTGGGIAYALAAALFLLGSLQLKAVAAEASGDERAALLDHALSGDDKLED